MQNIQHRPASPPLLRIRPIAIQTVFTNIEIKRRQIRRAKMMDRRVNPGPVMALNRPVHQRVDLPKPMQNQPLQLRNFPPAISRPHQTHPETPKSTATYSAAFDKAQPAASKSPAQCANPQTYPSSSPTAAKYPRRIYRSLPAGRNIAHRLRHLPPCSSSTNPSVTIALNGATPRVPTLSSNEA